jgi:hypothetical protein
MSVFVVVHHDRHIDAQITAHASLGAANRKIDEIKADYAKHDRAGDSMVWIETAIDHVGPSNWRRFVDTPSGDPRMMILELEIGT